MGPPTRHKLLTCAACGPRSGPWLVVCWKGEAWVTCPCGARQRHRHITPDTVHDNANDHVRMFESVEDVITVERALGYSPRSD